MSHTRISCTPAGVVRRVLRLVLCAAVVSVIVPVTTASAASPGIWAGPGGSDSTGVGSKANPYRTITRALEDAQNHDTVYVLPGTYDTAAGETFPIDLSQGASVIGVGPGPARVVGNGLHAVFYAMDPGGGVYTIAASITLRGLDISGSGSSGDAMSGGGVVFVSVGPGDLITVEHCRIHDNATGAGAGGGGVFASAATGGHVVLRYLTIEDNVANGGGGGVFFAGSDLGGIEINNCVVRGNTTTGGSSSGGGIYMSHPASVTVDRCEVNDNTAANFGGGMSIANAGAGSITNTLVARNSAPVDSAVWFANETLDVYGCTFTENVNSSGGGSSVHATTGTFTMRSCIAWGNSPAASTGFTYSRSCLEDGTQTGTGVIHTDPLFVTEGSVRSNYRLQRTSPCIDAGDVAPARSADLDGWPRPVSGDLKVADMGCYESASGGALRIAGENRYETASAAWADSWVLGKAYTGVVTTGENFPDALSASALAGAVRGPLLLTRASALSPEVTQRLSALGVTGVYLIGGESAVSAAVESQLVAAGYNVKRIAGLDRYDTAARVAEEVRVVTGTSASEVLIARGDTFPDALAASPWAYAQAAPILLTKSTSLPSVSAAALAASASDATAYILGSETAITAGVMDAIDEVPSIGATVRLGGVNRYETAAKIADYAVGTAKVVNWQRPALATGTGFADALAGGAAAGARGSALLLTAPQTLPGYTSDALASRSTIIQRLLILGGTSAVSDAVKNAATALID